MENNQVQILFEDDHLLAVNKPAGLVVHGDGRTTEASLVEWVSRYHPNLKDVGGLHTLDSGRYVERYGVVHRLDRDTSGVIIIAKDSETFFFLQRQFIERTNTKTYNAFVWGEMNKQNGVIDFPIGRARIDFRQWAVGNAARGTLRKAITEWSLEKTTNGVSYVTLSPKTGRTHQLRVHLKAIGHPILCDKRYESVCGLDFERLALHASRLSVMHPNGVTMEFVAPLPVDFENALKYFS